MRRKLRRLASSSRNARATVQGSDGRLLLCVPVILHLRSPSRAARCVRAVAHLQKKCAGARLAERLICGEPGDTNQNVHLLHTRSRIHSFSIVVTLEQWRRSALPTRKPTRYTLTSKMK